MERAWARPLDRAFLQLRGPDAVRFLNGQVSNRIDVDLGDRVVPACLCSIKGRVEALVWITAGPGEDALLIETEATQAEAVHDRIDRYLIADDCELSLLGDRTPRIHLIGDEPPAAGARECWRFGVRGFDLDTDQAPEGAAEIGEAEIARLTVRHGIPRSGCEITGEEFPSELGLDRWAVDFAKGCYLGQEVISRIESVGRTKNRLALYRTAEPFAGGHRFTGETEKTGGRVTRDSVPWEGAFLTPIFARNGWEPPGFEELAIHYPDKR